jgi:hypothetical protein
MMKYRYRFGMLACSLLGVGACATIPKSKTPESSFAQLSCPDLGHEAEEASETEGVALKARKAAWKVILPGAVVVRYVHANNALKEARRRTQKINDERNIKECMASSA